MSQQYPQGPHGPQPGPFQSQPFQSQPGAVSTPPKKPKRWVPWVVAAGTFVLGLVIGAAPNASIGAAAGSPQATVTKTVQASPTAATTTAPPAPETTEPPAPAYATPKTTDFKLTVKVLTKQCFGSAGCNVTYRILVAYSGPDLDPATTYEVLYQVKGGEDGPIDNKLTVTGNQSSVDEEEMVSTKSNKAKLSVVVTDVLTQ